MKHRALLGLFVLLFLAISWIIACQPQPPTPAPVISGVRSAGQGRASLVLTPFSGAVATTTQKTFSTSTGEYASAQVWYEIVMPTMVGVTATLYQSPDNTNWAESYILAYTATKALSYTLFSDIGRYWKITMDMTSTETVTPTMWLVLKD